MERRRLAMLEAPMERVRRELRAGESRAVLDVGGGTGATAEAVSAGCPRVVVLEPNGRRRRTGAKRRPAFEFVAGTAEQVPFPDASFDRVLASVSLHHFRDVGRALAEMRRVLAPDGLLVIFELAPDSHTGRFLRRFANHVSLLGAEQLKAHVRDAGFVGIETFAASPGYVLRASRR